MKRGLVFTTLFTALAILALAQQGDAEAKKEVFLLDDESLGQDTGALFDSEYTDNKVKDDNKLQPNKDHPRRSINRRDLVKDACVTCKSNCKGNGAASCIFNTCFGSTKPCGTSKRKNRSNRKGRKRKKRKRSRRRRRRSRRRRRNRRDEVVAEEVPERRDTALFVNDSQAPTLAPSFYPTDLPTFYPTFYPTDAPAPLPADDSKNKDN